MSAAWTELSDGLHHQGDVGEASYAAVPHLVRIHQARGVLDWNTYALVGTIDLARDYHRNPPVPAWLHAEYVAAINHLAELALRELPSTTDRATVLSLLAVLAIWRGARTHGRALLELSEAELREMDPRLGGEDESTRAEP